MPEYTEPRLVRKSDYDCNSPETLTAENDREWFEDHPARFLRLRRKTDGDPGVASHCLVFCPFAEPRFGRARLPFTPPARAKVHMNWGDDVLVHLLRKLLWKVPSEFRQRFDDVLAFGGRLPNPREKEKTPRGQTGG